VSDFGLKPVQVVSSDDEAWRINSLNKEAWGHMTTVNWLVAQVYQQLYKPIELSSYSQLQL
jgi:hypothetical protein